MIGAVADAVAEPYADVAVSLTYKVRYDPDPTVTHRWLVAAMRDVRHELDPPTTDDWVALAMILAAAVPIDQSWRSLTAWTWLRYHGTGGKDTPEAIAQRRRDLAEALEAIQKDEARRVAS